MDHTFWERCVAARCVVVPLTVYSQFGTDGKLHREHCLGIKFAVLPLEGDPAGPEYYFGIEEHHAGLDGLYESPEAALAAREAKIGARS